MATPADIEAALARMKKAARVVADILDAGERDPTWHESQELENAAIEYGRAERAAEQTPTTPKKRAKRSR